MGRDWYRVTHWDERAREEFEVRLARSRPGSGAQYLRIQGVTLWESGNLKGAKALLHRVVDQHIADVLEASAATEQLGQIAVQEGDLATAEVHFRSLLSRWPGLNGTTGTAEILLADVLSRRASAGAQEESLELLERFLDREDGIRWSTVMFQWQLVRVRLAEHRGEHDLAGLHAADALHLVATGPQFPHHQGVGVVHTDEVTLRRLRRLAGPSLIGTGAPYGRASAQQMADREGEQALLGDLASVGIDVPDVYALDPDEPGYARALPILFRHLKHESHPVTFRCDIARALGITRAAPLWEDMVGYYHALEPGSPVRDGLAAALSEAATKAQLAQVVHILGDRGWGEHRVYFLRTLTRLRHPDRWSLIESFTDDEQIGPEATRMLIQSRLRNPDRGMRPTS